MPTINNPDGRYADVDSGHRLLTSSISESENAASNDRADGFNINTGSIAITADSALLYMKNNEDRDWQIELIVLGYGVDTYTAENIVTIRLNPTGGTLISAASVVADVTNRNAGSADELAATVYKGVSGSTVTGGSIIGPVYQIGAGRLSIPIAVQVPKGSSVSIETTFGASSANVYAAIVGHRHAPA